MRDSRIKAGTARWSRALTIVRVPLAPLCRLPLYHSPLRVNSL